MGSPDHNCQYCSGSGEIALLGPNTTSCPCIDSISYPQPENWRFLVWMPQARGAGLNLQPQVGEMFCWPDADDSNGFVLQQQKSNRWKWECVSECSICNGQRGIVDDPHSIIETLSEHEHMEFNRSISRQ